MFLFHCGFRAVPKLHCAYNSKMNLRDIKIDTSFRYRQTETAHPYARIWVRFSSICAVSVGLENRDTISCVGFGLLQFQYSIFHCICQALFEKESENRRCSCLVKQPPFDLGADGVVNGQMILLHHKGFGCGNADGNVANLRQFSARCAGQADCGDADRFGGFGGEDDIFGVAGGGNSEKHIPRPRAGKDGLRIDQLRLYIVCKRAENGALFRQGDGAQALLEFCRHLGGNARVKQFLLRRFR